MKCWKKDAMNPVSALCRHTQAIQTQILNVINPDFGCWHCFADCQVRSILPSHIRLFWHGFVTGCAVFDSLSPSRSRRVHHRWSLVVSNFIAFLPSLLLSCFGCGYSVYLHFHLFSNISQHFQFGGRGLFSPRLIVAPLCCIKLPWMRIFSGFVRGMRRLQIASHARNKRGSTQSPIPRILRLLVFRLGDVRSSPRWY